MKSVIYSVILTEGVLNLDTSLYNAIQCKRTTDLMVIQNIMLSKIVSVN